VMLQANEGLNECDGGWFVFRGVHRDTYTILISHSSTVFAPVVDSSDVNRSLIAGSCPSCLAGLWVQAQRTTLRFELDRSYGEYCDRASERHGSPANVRTCCMFDRLRLEAAAYRGAIASDGRQASD
jgi:hypothetical protein